jgi:hypothetical protein
VEQFFREPTTFGKNVSMWGSHPRLVGWFNMNQQFTKNSKEPMKRFNNFFRNNWPSRVGPLQFCETLNAMLPNIEEKEEYQIMSS